MMKRGKRYYVPGLTWARTLAESLALATLIVSLVASGTSGSVEKLDLEQLVQKSARVINGRVTNLRSYWENGRIFTDVTIDISSYILGSGLSRRVIRVPGGTVGGITELVSDVPHFELNEEVIVFTRGQFFEVVGWYQGKFTVEDNFVVEAGQEKAAFISDIEAIELRMRGPPMKGQLGELIEEAYEVLEPIFRQKADQKPPSDEESRAKANMGGATQLRPQAWGSIKTEGFEGAWPNEWDCFAASGYADAYWGDEDSGHEYSGYWSGYCADDGTDGVEPPGPYPADMRTWMIYGPFSLADASGAELLFYVWSKTESNYDYFKYLVSTNGTNFYGYKMSGDWASGCGGFCYRNFDLTAVPTLGNICGQPQVWIAFLFTSDGTVQYEGAYLDDISLRKYVSEKPVINFISPTSGPAHAAQLHSGACVGCAGDSTLLTINGSNFGAVQGTSYVRFWRSGSIYYNGCVDSWSNNQIRVRVPGCVSSGNVLVHTTEGDSNTKYFTVTYSYGGGKWPGSHPMSDTNWANQRFYDVNPNTTDATRELEAVQAAARTWNAVCCADFKFRYGGTTDTAVVNFDDHRNVIFWNPNDIGSIATNHSWWYNSDPHTLIQFDIEFNDTLHWGTQGSAWDYDVQSIATHELGHSLMLLDLYGTADTEKTMYGIGAAGEMQNRSLHQDDIAGICYIYPDHDNDPIPSLSITGPPPNSIDLGDSFDITVEARNNGGDADGFSSLSFSFPTLDEVDDKSQVAVLNHDFSGSGNYLGKWAVGETIWDKNGNSMSANYLLVEGGYNDTEIWPAGHTHFMQLGVTPEEPGPFIVYIRATLVNDACVSEKYTDPASSSYIDQQGFRVYRYVINVQEVCIACAPTSCNPPDGSSGVSVNPTLSWSCSGGSGWTSFDIYFGTSSNPPLVNSNYTSTSYTPGTLQCETHYYWKVVANKTDCDPVTGPIWDFTTEACQRCQACTPTNPNPSDGVPNVLLNPTLSWSCSGGDGWTSFDIYFGTSSNPPLVNSNHTSTSYSPGTLQCDTHYYWKVVANKTDCDPVTGPIWDFTTEACERCQACTPQNPNPSDGALNVSVNHDLSWSCSGGDGWTSFDIYFGTSSNPPLVNSNHTSTSYSPGTLQCDTRYYWKVVANKTDCDPVTGPIWDFRTYTSSQRQCISLVTSWNFISLGLEPDNPSPQAVFDEVTGTLYLWNWDANTEAWKTVINGLLTQVRALGGYWIWLPQGLTVCVEGTPLTGDHALALGPAGWQQIGVPYDVAWGTGNGGSIMVEHAGEVKSLAEAVAAGWIFGTIWEWDSLSEAWIKPTVLTGATLDPWTGYWIYTFRDGLVLHFSPAGPGEPPPPTTMSVKTTVPAAPPKPQEPSPELLALKVINDPNPIYDVHTTTFRVLGVCPCSIQALRMKVYDLAGRLVWEGAGDTASLTWHTQNMLGEYLSNGVYLYQAQVKISGEWVTTPLEKLAILR